MNQKDAINLLSLIGGLLVTIVILAAFNAYVIITPGQA
ncbi:MAG: prohibitin family protein, partial [Microcystis sp. LE19-12.2C]|nr:prohibitin family protein [Microcystis sp. LE19-12.2C]